MKKKKWVITVLIIMTILILGIFAVLKNNSDEIGAIPISVMEKLLKWGWIEPTENVEYVHDDTFYTVIPDSVDDICEYSDTIIKAKYIKRESFDDYSDIFIFKLEKDYIGNVDEKQIHVYADKEHSFIQGKSYYLFMSSLHSTLYPHVVYSRNWGSFLVGEIKTGDSIQYTFSHDYSLGLDKVDDISKYLEKEIVEKGIYVKTERKSLEDAVKEADAIYKIKIESVDKVNRYVANCKYSVKEELRERYPVGKPRELPSVLAPGDTKEGDEFIVLLKYNEDYQSYGVDYSSVHFIYPFRSSEARYIIKSADK